MEKVKTKAMALAICVVLLATAGITIAASEISNPVMHSIARNKVTINPITIDNSPTGKVNLATFETMIPMIRQGVSVAVLDTYVGQAVKPVLEGAGFETTLVSRSDVENGVLPNYGVFVTGHMYEQGTSDLYKSQIEVFAQGGGGIVSEWDSSTPFFSEVGPDPYYVVTPLWEWFDGTVDKGDYVGTGTPVDIIDTAHPIVQDISDPFSAGVATEFFYTVSNMDPSLHVIAQYDGYGGTWPAIIVGNKWNANIAMFMFDAGDDLSYDDIQKLWINAVSWAAQAPSPSVTISTDAITYSAGDTMIVTLDIANPTIDPVTFEWYIGVPQLGIWVTYASAPIPAGFDNSYTIPIPVGDWGPTPFGLVHYVHMLDPVSGDVLVQDVALCAYSPGVGEAMPVDIEEEIKKTVERVELPI